MATMENSEPKQSSKSVFAQYRVSVLLSAGKRLQVPRFADLVTVVGGLKNGVSIRY